VIRPRGECVGWSSPSKFLDAGEQRCIYAQRCKTLEEEERIEMRSASSLHRCNRPGTQAAK
jgi:hypothetical protein